MDGKYFIFGIWEGEFVCDNFQLIVKKYCGNDKGVIFISYYNLKVFEDKGDFEKVIMCIYVILIFQIEGSDEVIVFFVVVESFFIN